MTVGVELFKKHIEMDCMTYVALALTAMLANPPPDIIVRLDPLTEIALQ